MRLVIDRLSFFFKISYNSNIDIEEGVIIMKFTANVTVIDAPEVEQRKRDTEYAKALIMRAIEILSKSEPSNSELSVVQEAESFLKEVGVA